MHNAIHMTLLEWVDFRGNCFKKGASLDNSFEIICHKMESFGNGAFKINWIKKVGYRLD